MPRLSKIEKTALAHFGLEYAKSEEPGAGWFAYTDMFKLHPDYPGTSCECLEDVVEWYKSAQQANQAELLTKRCPECGMRHEPGKNTMCRW